jgi:hypothetical protein
MADEIRLVKDVEQEPGTVGTPEGDNEFGPDVPLKPVEGEQVPMGGGEDGYKKDK